MTVYTEKTIPSAEEVVVVLFMGLPIPVTSSIYAEGVAPAVAYGECVVPATSSTECTVAATAYTEKTI